MATSGLRENVLWAEFDAATGLDDGVAPMSTLGQSPHEATDRNII